MRISVLRILVILLVQGLSSCTPSSLSEEGLYAYIKDPDHRLIVEQKVSDVKMSCYYKPSELVALPELRNNEVGKKDSIVKYYEQYLYFIATISIKDQNLEQYYAINQYSTFGSHISDMSFHMKEYFYITTESSVKINPLEVVSPRVFGSANASSFMLIFDRAALKDAKEFKIHYTDSEIGNFSFPYSMSDIYKVSQIKISNR